MGLDDAIDVVESLNIVAGTIPLFGSTVQSSLAALSKILQIANVRPLTAYLAGVPELIVDSGSRVE
jgi:hypothetical protein